MNVSIIGTGNMARGIATRLLAGGHTVTLVGHETGKAQELADQLRSAAQSSGSVTAATGDQLAGEIVVLAVPWSAAVPIVQQYGAQLANKIVIDITNPIDFNTMEPVIALGSSGTEELAQALPAGAKVFKAFNTTFAGTLVAGQVAGQPLDVFIAGDDAVAKATITQLVESSGLRPIDAGPITRARQLEAVGLLNIAMQFTLGTNFGSALKILT